MIISCVLLTFVVVSKNSNGQISKARIKNIETDYSYKKNSDLIWTYTARSTKIDGKLSLNRFKQEYSQEAKIRDILEEDVLGYYQLKKKYDSDLKVKLFKDTEEYRELLSRLKKDLETLKGTYYYVDFELSYYERIKRLNYNVNEKIFTMTNDIYKTEETPLNNSVQFDHILVPLQNGLKVTRNTYPSGSIDFVKQHISIQITDEEKALEIENNKEKLKLLVRFKFDKLYNYINEVAVGKYRDSNFITSDSEFYLYNEETGKIYHSFK